jgi:hypothetical protein
MVIFFEFLKVKQIPQKQELKAFFEKKGKRQV